MSVFVTGGLKSCSRTVQGTKGTGGKRPPFPKALFTTGRPSDRVLTEIS